MARRVAPRIDACRAIAYDIASEMELLSHIPEEFVRLAKSPLIREAEAVCTPEIVEPIKGIFIRVNELIKSYGPDAIETQEAIESADGFVTGIGDALTEIQKVATKGKINLRDCQTAIWNLYQDFRELAKEPQKLKAIGEFASMKEVAARCPAELTTKIRSQIIRVLNMEDTFGADSLEARKAIAKAQGYLKGVAHGLSSVDEFVRRPV